jgi:hypothetical protein
MQGFQRVESKFAPIPDGTYTMYAVEATFVISSQKGTPGVNFKFKLDDMTEEGQPQPNAGKTFFLTKYLTDKTVGDFCQLLDSMGFQTDAKGLYLMPDGSLMPDFLKMADKETISFLVGIPFVGKLTCKVDVEYDKSDGTKGTKDEYNIRPNWVVPADGGRKVIQLSNHPNKAAAFALAGGAPLTAPSTAFGAPPVPPAGAVAFQTGRGF